MVANSRDCDCSCTERSNLNRHKKESTAFQADSRFGFGRQSAYRK